jgi:hypothetical protein
MLRALRQLAMPQFVEKRTLDAGIKFAHGSG